MNSELLLGAVCYDPKVVTIWEGFKQYFLRKGLLFDYVLYSNYDRQVDALLGGQIDVAWNSPLAWVKARRVAVATGIPLQPLVMRDTDCDVRSAIVVKDALSMAGVEALRGKTVAVGASDSPQATLLPLSFLADQGLQPGVDFNVQRHELLLGLHGDHVGGERAAVESLLAGHAEAACILEANYLAFIGDGTISPFATSALAYTPAFDHCNMTAGPSADSSTASFFRDLLLAMSYQDPEVKPLFDMEGLTSWREARLSGYGLLEEAVDRLGFYQDLPARTVNDPLRPQTS